MLRVHAVEQIKGPRGLLGEEEQNAFSEWGRERQETGRQSRADKADTDREIWVARTFPRMCVLYSGNA